MLMDPTLAFSISGVLLIASIAAWLRLYFLQASTPTGHSPMDTWFIIAATVSTMTLTWTILAMLVMKQTSLSAV
jgi:hypothetical protein